MFGHTPPREGSEVVLDPGEVEVGVVMLEDPVGMPKEETESPVRVPEETPEVGAVELVGPIGAIVWEPEMDGADLGGPFVGTTGGVLAVAGADVGDSLGVFETELEETAVALEEIKAPRGALDAGAVELMETTEGPGEKAVPKVVEEAEEALKMGRGDLRTTLFVGEGIVAVLLGDNGTLVLGGVVPLEAGTVVAFTDEGSTITVVVVVS
ncbi:MAG: hypothetical protein ALECFALPRED_005983 [Alectoria fallacina]|uniref:Uncharacterized protein n=1 Tax=Alectoria fallacina TaxID=1903189 RepID=A0A8H3IDL2_9LECA|nr:MAG: hypothetical protein ALECFALPRED_005983 [Alectoria fallacina]